MAGKKAIVISNLEKGRTCNNCGLSYRKYLNREEKQEFDALKIEWTPNTCGSKIRKKLNLPKDLTCEHWYSGTETYTAESRLSTDSEKVEKTEESSENELI